MLTTHDREYFTRTLPIRLQLYLRLCPTSDFVMEQPFIMMDLTTIPIEVHYSSQIDCHTGACTDQVIVAKYPTGEKIGKSILLSMPPGVLQYDEMISTIDERTFPSI